MEPFVPVSVVKMSFLAENGYSGYERSRYESIYESIPMHSSPFPWQVFPDIPVPSQCEFETCGVHCNPTLPPLPHVHGTSRFSPGPPREAFCCNYEPFVLPCVSSVSSLTTTAPSTKKGKGQSEQNKEKKLTCGICKKTFLRPSAIRVHMRVHNGEKPFKCIYCPRSFSQSGNLTVHLRMHTGERPFTCPICCKGFSQSNSLKVHIRTHTGEKPFQCKSCMKRFADRSSLAKHIRVHGDDDVSGPSKDTN